MLRHGLPALAALVAFAVVPATAAAQIEIRSGHDADLRVRGDRRGYALVSDTVLAFSVEGPGELELTLRQDFGRGQTPGRLQTKILMSQDGGPLPPVVLKQRLGGRWRGARKTRPSRPHLLRVQVPEGVHRYMVRVATRGHRLAVALAFEPAAPADLALVPLAAIGASDEIPLAGLGPATDDEIPLAGLGPAADDEIPLAGLGPATDDEIPLAGLGPSGAANDEIPLAGLGPATDDEIPLAGLGPSGAADDEIPLMGLGHPTGDDDAIPLASLGKATSGSDDDMPLASLGSGSEGGELALAPLTGGTDEDRAGTRGDEGAQTDTSGTGVAVASLGPADTTDGTGRGGLVGAPLHEPRPPRQPGPILLAVRGLAAETGMGSGSIGGGLDVHYQTQLLDGGLSLGISADVLPYRLKIQAYRADGSILRSTVPIQALPVLASASYVLPGSGPVRWQATGGLGLVHATASEGRRQGTAFLLGGALGFGPLYRAGPGHLAASVRLTGTYGSIRDGNGQAIVNGPLGGFGVTMGYQLRL